MGMTKMHQFEGVTRGVAGMVGALALAFAFALAVVLQPACALGDEGASEGSSLDAVGGGSHSATYWLPQISNHYIWLSESLELEGDVLDNNLLAVGDSVDFRDCAVQGSVRVLAHDINLENVGASDDVTTAANSITLSNVDANTIVAVGNDVSVSGSCETLGIYARDVLIDGVVEGDVIVDADSITVGPNARIKGTLFAAAQANPFVDGGAEVADINFTLVHGRTMAERIRSVIDRYFAMLETAVDLICILGTLVMALFVEWLFGRHTAAAVEMIRSRTGAFIGAGVIGAIAAPVAFVILCLLVVTLPVANALLLALLALSAVAGGFMGASLSKLAFPRLGRFRAAMAGGAIVGLAIAIPDLSIAVCVIVFIYLLGYVLQCIRSDMRAIRSQGSR